MEAKQVACAHKSCKCQANLNDSVRHEGLLFCSKRCAEGRGCDHPECNCGDFPMAEPARR